MDSRQNQPPNNEANSQNEANSGKKPFILKDTWLGYFYTNAFLLKGLFDLARYAKYLSPLQLASGVIGAGGDMARQLNQKQAADMASFVASALSFVNDPFSFATMYTLNLFGDSLIEDFWNELSEEQKQDPKWQEFIAFLSIAKMEANKKIVQGIQKSIQEQEAERAEAEREKQKTSTAQPSSQAQNKPNQAAPVAENQAKIETQNTPVKAVASSSSSTAPVTTAGKAPEISTTAPVSDAVPAPSSADLNRLKQDMQEKQDQANQAGFLVKRKEWSVNYWNDAIDKNFNDELNEKFRGKSYDKFFIKGEKHKEYKTEAEAREIIKNGGTVFMRAEKKHGNKGVNDKPVNLFGDLSAERRQELIDAQAKAVAATAAADQAKAAYETARAAAEAEAARQSQEAARQAQEAAARAEAVRQAQEAAARAEAVRQAQEAARQAQEAAAKAEAARQVQEATAKAEAARQAAAQEAARAEAARQAAAQEAARAEAARQAAAQEAARAEAAKQTVATNLGVSIAMAKNTKEKNPGNTAASEKKDQHQNSENTGMQHIPLQNSAPNDAGTHTQSPTILEQINSSDSNKLVSDDDSEKEMKKKQAELSLIKEIEELLLSLEKLDATVQMALQNSEPTHPDLNTQSPTANSSPHPIKEVLESDQDDSEEDEAEIKTSNETSAADLLLEKAIEKAMAEHNPEIEKFLSKAFESDQDDSEEDEADIDIQKNETSAADLLLEKAIEKSIERSLKFADSDSDEAESNISNKKSIAESLLDAAIKKGFEEHNPEIEKFLSDEADLLLEKAIEESIERSLKFADSDSDEAESNISNKKSIAESLLDAAIKKGFEEHNPEIEKSIDIQENEKAIQRLHVGDTTFEAVQETKEENTNMQHIPLQNTTANSIENQARVSNLGAFSQTRRGGNTFGDYLQIPIEVAKNGGDKKSQVAAQQTPRRFQ